MQEVTEFLRRAARLLRREGDLFCVNCGRPLGVARMPVDPYPTPGPVTAKARTVPAVHRFADGQTRSVEPVTPKPRSGSVLLPVCPQRRAEECQAVAERRALLRVLGACGSGGSIVQARAR